MDYEFDEGMSGCYRRAFNRWHRYHCEPAGGRDRRFRCASRYCGSHRLTFVAFAKYERDGKAHWYAELKCEDCPLSSYVILDPNSDYGGYTIESTTLWYYNGNFERAMENRRKGYGRGRDKYPGQGTDVAPVDD